MPLAFESTNHGTIAFGFFNIESDMLLLDHYFFFATDFCKGICDFLVQFDDEFKCSIPAYYIETNADIGDLHGGIAGTHYSGFIGETYKRYPFPTDNSFFKQQTNGYKTQDAIGKIIMEFAKTSPLLIKKHSDNQQVAIGPYLFSQHVFDELINYVIQGGFPKWLDDDAPKYVRTMKAALV